ncbi:MAG: CopG family transcriptional regulator [Acidimicrobiales bacterium]
MTKKIDEMLAEEGAAAENHELPDDLPESVRVSRPNVGRATVVSIRLSRGEHEELQRAAEEARLPLSTLLRIWALDRLNTDAGAEGANVSARLERLEKAVFDRSA